MRGCLLGAGAELEAGPFLPIKAETTLSDCVASPQSGRTVIDEAEHGEVGARSDRRLNRVLFVTVLKFIQILLMKKTALYIAQLPALDALGEFPGEILRQRVLRAPVLSANSLADADVVVRISLSERNRDLVGREERAAEVMAFGGQGDGVEDIADVRFNRKIFPYRHVRLISFFACPDQR